MLSSKHQPLVVCYALVLVLLISATAVNSFHIRPVTNGFLKTTSKRYDSISNTSYCSRKLGTRVYSDNTRGANGKTKFGQKTDSEVSRFLTDFRTADGSVVDPYKLLQVKRSATKMEIKQSYRRLSRKLHPDMVAQSDILPGRCQNLDDVRAEWERVKFSYEILSDPKMRKSYDRNSSVASVLDDPGKAVGRAVLGGAMSGIGLVFGSAWKIGEIATKKAYEVAVAADKKENVPSKVSNDAPQKQGKPKVSNEVQQKQGMITAGSSTAKNVQETNNMEESKNASKQSNDYLSTLTPIGSSNTNTNNNPAKSKQSISIDSKSSNTTRALDAKKNNTAKTVTNKLGGGSDVAMKTITPPPTSSSTTTAAKGQKKKKAKSLQTRGGKGFSKQ